jgi:hypothetical protein
LKENKLKANSVNQGTINGWGKLVENEKESNNDGEAVLG